MDKYLQHQGLLPHPQTVKEEKNEEVSSLKIRLNQDNPEILPKKKVLPI